MALKGREFDLRRVAPVQRRGVSGRTKFKRFKEVTIMRPSGAQTGTAGR
jgi:hypothetical protein